MGQSNDSSKRAGIAGVLGKIAAASQHGAMMSQHGAMMSQLLVEAAADAAKLATGELPVDRAAVIHAPGIEPHFTVPEAATIAKRSVRSLRDKVKNGRVRSVMVDGRRLIPESALRAYLGGDDELDAEVLRTIAPPKLRVMGGGR